MDVYQDKIYSIENGQFVLLHEGNYGAVDNSHVQFDSGGNPIYHYYWDGTEVSSESEYMNLLNEVYNDQQAVTPFDGAEYDSETWRYVGNGLCDYEEIIEAINTYGDVNGAVQTQGQQRATSDKEQVAGTWEIDPEKTNAANDLSLWSMFGSGIKYGDELVLNEDGTASWYIGIGNGGSGTYVLDESTVTLTYVDYEEQDQRVMTLRSLEEAGKSYIRMNYENYDLYWVKK